MISGALVHTCQFDRKSLDKCKPWMEVVQRVLFVLNPAWSRTFPHIADPAKWCKGFFLHSSYLFCALSFESLLCRCFQFKSLCAKSQLGMFWLLAELLSVFDSFFFFVSAGSHRLKQLLSFAIGGLLGNVFLHLLPEAWAYTCSATTGMKVLCVWKQSVLCLLLHFLSPFRLKNTRPARLRQPKNWSRLVFSFK